MGRRRRAAAIASPSRVCAFSAHPELRQLGLESLRDPRSGAGSALMLISSWARDRRGRRRRAPSHAPDSISAISTGCRSLLDGDAADVGERHSCTDVEAGRLGDLELLGTGAVAVAAGLVVPDPPLVRLVLRVALGRVLPLLLPTERGDVEVVPGVAHLLVAAGVDEVGAVHLVAVTDERVGAVPLVDAEVLVEVVEHRDPGDVLPAHARLDPLDVGLRARVTRTRATCRARGGAQGARPGRRPSSSRRTRGRASRAHRARGTRGRRSAACDRRTGRPGSARRSGVSKR